MEQTIALVVPVAIGLASFAIVVADLVEVVHGVRALDVQNEMDCSPTSFHQKPDDKPAHWMKHEHSYWDSVV